MRVKSYKNKAALDPKHLSFSFLLHVRVTQQKSITFSKAPIAPELLGVRSRLLAGVCPSLFATQNRGFVSQTGRGMPLPTCDTSVVLQMHDLHCAIPWSVSQGGRGMPLPLCDTKPRFCVADKALDQKVGFRHLRHARSSRFVKSASFDETKRLGGHTHHQGNHGGLGHRGDTPLDFLH